MKRLWLLLAVVLIASFTVLGHIGTRIREAAPPIPERVVTPDGQLVIAPSEIATGQNVWQALGGMQLGSLWGHGSYVAPDWTADWLHREATFVLDTWAHASRSLAYERLSSEEQAALRVRLQKAMRTNTYDPATRTLTLTPERAQAFAANLAHYSDVFRHGRREYAIPAGALTRPEDLRCLAAFFFWSSWAASTERPGEHLTYTSNWPHEPLVGNTLPGSALLWSGLSILLLIGFLGAMIWWRGAAAPESRDVVAPTRDPLAGLPLYPSQRASLKFFGLALALFLLQIGLGGVTAHFGVEGDGFYGVPLARWLPYVITRTWHTQLGIYWIATTWLATGLFVGPLIGGHEPRGQRLGVNVLFGALLVVVLGSMGGQWLSVHHKMGLGQASSDAWFYFGHSGYEYIDLGRAWQIGLYTGLFLWLGLVVRAILPALRKRDERRPLVLLFALSALAIAGFYGAALGYGKHTHLAVAEYWRWWVVHLWVEGFFEVFATVVVAFLFARLGLLSLRATQRALLLSSTIFLASGIIGTLHHLYFAGTPEIVQALGSVFSALEVVPLVFIGYEAWENYRLIGHAPWMARYRWPIYFFMAVAFWNLVGAGLFGFLINPPASLYYVQGLNTTPLHGHTALFGVYGMLGIALMLFCVRAARPAAVWREGVLGAAFWLLNGGLLAMALLSLLPIGVLQARAAIDVGYWYARSPEFLQSGLMNTLRWMRAVGDVAFAAGAGVLVAFVTGLATGHAIRRQPANASEESTPPKELPAAA
ncbi:MAG TPA: nitric-oxide reductase large subunit [Polyangia bacterium]|nr:nitric-oxide reductase large subunit [Polyangia bacterium]